MTIREFLPIPDLMIDEYAGHHGDTYYGRCLYALNTLVKKEDCEGHE